MGDAETRGVLSCDVMLTGMRIFSGLTLLLLCASIHGEEVSPFEDASTMALVQEGSDPVTHKAEGAKASKALPKAVHAGEHKAADNSLYQKQTELYNKMLTSGATSEVTVLAQVNPDPDFGDILSGRSVPDPANFNVLTNRGHPDIAFVPVLLQLSKKKQPQGDTGAGFGGNPDPAFDGPNNGHVSTGPGSNCDPVTESGCTDLAQRNTDGDIAFKGKDPAMQGANGATVPDVAFHKGAAKIFSASLKRRLKKTKKAKKKKENKNTVAPAVTQHVTKKAAEVDF